MSTNTRILRRSSIALQLGLLMGLLSLALGCGGGAEGNVLRVDAEFDFDVAASVIRPIDESNLLVAQTFEVGQTGVLDEFWVVLIDGVSADDGIVRLTVRPLDGTVPDSDEASSLITPIDVDTSTLASFGDAVFEVFDFGDESEIGREVTAGDELAIVVEFISRATSTDTDPIASLLGVDGDPFAGGTGSEDPDDTGFVNSTDDYFFRTFVLSAL